MPPELEAAGLLDRSSSPEIPLLPAHKQMRHGQTRGMIPSDRTSAIMAPWNNATLVQVGDGRSAPVVEGTRKNPPSSEPQSH